MRLWVICVFATVLLTPTKSVAQEYPGNFWINPATGDAEEINLNSIPMSPASAASTDRWLDIVTLPQGQDRIQVDTASRQTVQGGRRRSIRFTTRTLSAQGTYRGSTRYTADCLSPKLNNGTGRQLPLGEGTIGDALYQWACRLSSRVARARPQL